MPATSHHAVGMLHSRRRSTGLSVPAARSTEREWSKMSRVSEAAWHRETAGFGMTTVWAGWVTSDGPRASADGNSPGVRAAPNVVTAGWGIAGGTAVLRLAFVLDEGQDESCVKGEAAFDSRIVT